MTRQCVYSKNKVVREIFKNSKSYQEFKMRLSISDIDLYNISIIQSILIDLSKVEFKNEFISDIYDNIDNIEPRDYIFDKMGMYAFKSGKAPKLDAFLINLWLKKHKNDYKKYE
jgi:hypothetical protein